MSWKIFKYPLQPAPKQIVKIPGGSGADLLAVQVQGDVPCLWALCQPGAAPEGVEILMFGTGHQIPDDTAENIYHIDTIQSGSIEWHFFGVNE